MAAHALPGEQAPPAAHVCVVYDRRDGRVVHTHEFIGSGFDRAECSRMAMATVEPVLESIKSLGINPSDTLRVLHVARGLPLPPGSMFRVNLATHELVSAEP